MNFARWVGTFVGTFVAVWVTFYSQPYILSPHERMVAAIILMWAWVFTSYSNT